MTATNFSTFIRASAAVCVLFIAGCPAGIETPQNLGVVTRVLDGDTVKFKRPDGSLVTIRLEGIDAPERVQRFGREATGWLAEATDGKAVEVVETGTDRYGRLLADLHVDGEWLNRKLVASGLAWHYVKYNKDTRLATAQNEARANRLGIWQDARRVAPWDYRNGQRVETALPANVESTRETDEVVFITESGAKYHREDCRYLGGNGTRIPVSRAASAYEPCKICFP